MNDSPAVLLSWGLKKYKREKILNKITINMLHNASGKGNCKCSVCDEPVWTETQGSFTQAYSHVGWVCSCQETSTGLSHVLQFTYSWVITLIWGVLLEWARKSSDILMLCKNHMDTEGTSHFMFLYSQRMWNIIYRRCSHCTRGS